MRNNKINTEQKTTFLRTTSTDVDSENLSNVIQKKKFH